ncbi:hypothetical protein L6164_013840 [Bauhinia variegata]|uniref:Uncharacterized protein n=1 Tax=Bauhinia variegata TaxID=167791 RepID=A0ACB9NFH2_BAUVA|nr:hypothetical protein L6164_013840 [Bauhinia variegata]
MNVFDSSSPLEALAFDYLSFGFLTIVNNLWTWVAVVTAAVSFWRIRAAGCSRPELPARDDPTPNGSHPVTEVLMSESDNKVDERRQEASVPAAAPATRPAVSGDVDVDGVTKGKFTVYYEDDCSQCESDEWTVTEEWEDCKAESDGCKSVLLVSWDKLLRLKMGENEWYMYQDLTKINGNVVKFWDSRFGTFAKEPRYSYSTSCFVW